MAEKILLSEIVAAVVDALDCDRDAPEAARARELTAQAGWGWEWVSWMDLLERIGRRDLPEPGLRNVLDDYSE